MFYLLKKKNTVGYLLVKLLHMLASVKIPKLLKFSFFAGDVCWKHRVVGSWFISAIYSKVF